MYTEVINTINNKKTQLYVYNFILYKAIKLMSIFINGG